MATMPAPKHHQPLHNFSLPFLKWGQRLQLNNHCHRHRHRHRRRHRNRSCNSPPTDSDSDHSTWFRNRKNNGETGGVLPEDGNGSRKVISVGVATADDGDYDLNNRKLFRNRKTDGVAGDALPENGNGSGNAIGVDVATADSSDSDVNNRTQFRNRNTDGKTLSALPENVNGSGNVIGVDVTETVAADDGDVKPWNLRPRRLVIDAVDGNVTPTTVNCAKSRRLLRGGAAADDENENEHGKKRRLWISLSKDEIEEDVYAFTGSRPVRRPKKRNRSAQKHVDNVFPGLYLVGVSADSYRL